MLIVMAVIGAVALISATCAVTLTLAATDGNAERFGSLADGFMDAFNACLIALISMVGGMQLSSGDQPSQAPEKQQGEISDKS